MCRYKAWINKQKNIELDRVSMFFDIIRTPSSFGLHNMY